MSLTRILVSWLILAVVMTANGILRELVLKRTMSSAAADTLSLGLGLALILVVTRLLFRIPRDYPIASLLLVGAFLVVLTIGFEFAMGMLVDQKSFRELVGAYAFWEGKTWPLVLVVLGLTPVIWRGRM